MKICFECFLMFSSIKIGGHMPKRKTTDKNFQDITQDIDILALQENIRARFSSFADPRESKRVNYPAWYIILLVLCGYLSGCNTITDLASFAELRTPWMNALFGSQFNAISYDTIWWFFVRIKPEAFQQLLREWVQALPKDLHNQLLSVDGKRLRGVSDNEHICHLVELFSAESRLVIAQERVPDKKCERKALPALLKSVDVKGAVIAMDAHYLYKEALQSVLDSGADFLVGIKGNQGSLADEVSNYFNQAKAIDYEDEEFQCHKTVDKGHGRIESRHICVSHSLDWLPGNDEWGFKTIIEVRSERIVKEELQQGALYYGTSRKATAKECAGWIRDHWLIENGCHWTMDVIFKEDDQIANVGYTAENTALLRRVCSNIVKMFDPARGLADARRNAMYEPSYLRGLLFRLFCHNC